MKKPQIRHLLSLIYCVSQLWACCANPTGPEQDKTKTLSSLRKIDDFPLYVMRYHGDYQLPVDPRDVKKSPSKGLHQQSPWSCTCFSALNENGDELFGRNFDWYDHYALFLYTNPSGGYASVSMVDISYLGFSENNLPEDNPDGLMGAPLIPFDGMNEHGLAIGMMALSNAEPPRAPSKQTIGSLLLIRLMLDYAKNIQEAVSIIEKYNIDFQGGPPLHYIIQDRSNRSVVVEFVDHQISLLYNSHPWHVSTNFILTGQSNEAALSSCWRYSKAWNTLEEHNAMMTSADALKLLEDVSQASTIWSVVYKTNTLDIQIVMGKKYGEIHDLKLEKN